MSELTEILGNLEITQRVHTDRRFKDVVSNTEQAILAWVDQDIIGEDEEPDIPASKRTGSKPSHSLRAHYINQTKAEQRKKLRS